MSMSLDGRLSPRAVDPKRTARRISGQDAATSERFRVCFDQFGDSCTEWQLILVLVRSGGAAYRRLQSQAVVKYAESKRQRTNPPLQRTPDRPSGVGVDAGIARFVPSAEIAKMLAPS